MTTTGGVAEKGDGEAVNISSSSSSLQNEILYMYTTCSHQRYMGYLGP